MKLLIRLSPIVIVLALLTFTSCGKRKPPQPPKERIPQRVQIAGKQVGDRIEISWTMPARNAAPGNTLQISRIDIFRLAEGLTQPLSLTEQEFDSRSTLIGSLPINASDFGLKTKTYVDQIAIVGQAARLRYAIKFVNSSGQKASFSNFFLIEPSPNIALSPADVSSKVSQEAITVSWTAPGANTDGSQPANIVGYNLYRKAGDKAFKKINDKPLTAPNYSDEAFSFGQTYQYVVRTVSLGRNAISIESFPSETFEVKPVDTFKPAPPDALTIASAPNSISLFFAFNLEKDIAGYRVYRSTNPNLAKADWKLVSAPDLEANTFQDEDVVPSVVYYYYVVAIDTAGNISSPSDVVNETAL